MTNINQLQCSNNYLYWKNEKFGQDLLFVLKSKFYILLGVYNPICDERRHKYRPNIQEIYIAFLICEMKYMITLSMFF